MVRILERSYPGKFLELKDSGDPHNSALSQETCIVTCETTLLVFKG